MGLQYVAQGCWLLLVFQPTNILRRQMCKCNLMLVTLVGTSSDIQYFANTFYRLVVVSVIDRCGWGSYIFIFLK